MPVQKPIIILFACMQCSYTALDLAGTLKIQYDPIVRVVRVPCTGRVDIIHVLKAIVSGADAVIVAPCHKGDCAYKLGNLAADRRVRFVKELLKELGLNPRRVQIHFVSAAEGAKIAEVINQVAREVIEEIGPSPFRKV
ncbi:MAG: hydrogenase iron-sulfur subunit [Candidatus Helarchaeales archaeon]